MLAHQLVPAIGVLTWAVALGMVAGNTGLLPRVAKQAPRGGDQAAAADRHRPARVRGVVRLDHGAGRRDGRPRRRHPGDHAGRDHVAREPDEARCGPQPADRHRVRHLRGLGHRRDGGHRRRRRGGRRGRDRDGHPLRHRGHGAAAAAGRPAGPQRRAVRHLGRGQHPRGRSGRRGRRRRRCRRRGHRRRRQADPGAAAGARRRDGQRPAAAGRSGRTRPASGRRSCRCSCSGSSPASPCAAPA